MLPEWRIFFDAGIQSPYNPEYLLITHGHSDHTFALPMIIKNITTLPTIIIPNGVAEYYKNFIDSIEILSSDGNIQSRREYELVEIEKKFNC